MLSLNWGGSHSQWKKVSVLSEKKRRSLKNIIDGVHTVISSSEHVTAVECLLDRRYGFKNLLAKQDLYSGSTYLA